MRSTFLRWMFWSQGAQGCTGEATFCLGIYVWRSFTPAMDDNYGLMVTNGNDHAKPFQYWNALKEIKSSEQDEDHSDHGPHSDNILHNHNVGHSNDDFWRHSNDAGNDFWCNKIKKKNSNHSCPVSGLQCLPCHWREHKASNTASRIYIYIIFLSQKRKHTGEIFPRNKPIKELRVYSIISILGNIEQNPFSWHLKITSNDLKNQMSDVQLPTRHR